MSHLTFRRSFFCYKFSSGEITFEEKARSCEAGGGAAVLIYNNVPGVVAGTLDTPTQVNIPVAGITQEDGIALLQGGLGKTVTLNSQDGYAYSDGTSFASPHVAGVAGKSRLCENFIDCGISLSIADVYTNSLFTISV